MNAVAHQTPARASWLRRLLKDLVRPAPQKYNSTQFINIVSALVIVIVLGFSFIMARWSISIDPQKIKCLPYLVYIQTKSIPDVVQRGHIYTYRAKGLEPLLKDGSPMAKIAAGVPGDRVRIDATGVYINGEFFGPLNEYVINKMKLDRQALYRNFVIPDGKYLMLGTLPQTYDSRYWGLVDAKQMQGSAFPVW